MAGTAAPADIRVKIRTTDSAWAAAHSETTTADGAVVVTVPAAAVERLTFAGQPMVRFDLRLIGERIPRDWPNPWAQLPASHVVTD